MRQEVDSRDEVMHSEMSEGVRINKRDPQNWGPLGPTPCSALKFK